MQRICVNYAVASPLASSRLRFHSLHVVSLTERSDPEPRLDIDPSDDGAAPVREVDGAREPDTHRLSGDPRLLESTLSNLDDWARSVRGGKTG